MHNCWNWNHLKKICPIVIQSADKGGAVVILDRKDYEFEIQRNFLIQFFIKN